MLSHKKAQKTQKNCERPGRRTTDDRRRTIVLSSYRQYPLQVVDEDGTILGDFIADLYVENCLIVELKACKAIIGDHIAQLLGYLRASRKEHGLLINFGASKLEVKKYVLSNCN